ncbi:cysteine--tRNA ligase [Candidatus Bathyarchaeota archaeon]|nr:cysteine--tRNA ligase [Candidatus Bathyarchaeota archaeon]
MIENKLKLFDTMAKEKRLFEPLTSEEVKVYACGPTVYGDPHIGNFRSFIVSDILHRWLEYSGYNVKFVMNITDIDDKTIRDSALSKISIKDFTKQYTNSFLRGLDLLNIKRASAYPRATEYINQMIEFIQILLDKNIAYITEDGIYFDIDKYPEYGKLSGVNLTETQKTDRIKKDEYEKDSIQDFALWKKSTPEEEQRSKQEEGIAWDAIFDYKGKTVQMHGRPGWHIECSVMTRSLLGDTLDIHAGGEDLVFPHHENEIAQTECLTGKQFVRYWLHIRHLMINGKKMSKSLGNYVSFDEVLSKYSADAFRYFYLNTHYRRPLDYTEDAMLVASNSIKKLENTLDLIENSLQKTEEKLDYGSEEEKFLRKVIEEKKSFETAMNDDLDSHTAIESLHNISGAINEYLTGQINKGVLLKTQQIYVKLLKVLGLFEKNSKISDELTEKLIKTLINLRNQYRKEKNYQKADEIRTKLSQIGIILTDNNEETNWKIEK